MFFQSKLGNPTRFLPINTSQRTPALRCRPGTAAQHTTPITEGQGQTDPLQLPIESYPSQAAQRQIYPYILYTGPSLANMTNWAGLGGCVGKSDNKSIIVTGFTTDLLAIGNNS